MIPVNLMKNKFKLSIKIGSFFEKSSKVIRAKNYFKAKNIGWDIKSMYGVLFSKSSFQYFTIQ